MSRSGYLANYRTTGARKPADYGIQRTPNVPKPANDNYPSRRQDTPQRPTPANDNWPSLNDIGEGVGKAWPYAKPYQKYFVLVNAAALADAYLSRPGIHEKIEPYSDGVMQMGPADWPVTAYSPAISANGPTQHLTGLLYTSSPPPGYIEGQNLGYYPPGIQAGTDSLIYPGSKVTYNEMYNIYGIQWWAGVGLWYVVNTNGNAYPSAQRAYWTWTGNTYPGFETWEWPIRYRPAQPAIVPEIPFIPAPKPQMTPMDVRTNGAPRKRPVKDPPDLVFGPRGRPATRPASHEFKRPPRGTKEPGKTGSYGPSKILSKILSSITEAGDVIDAVYDALPDKIRKKAWGKYAPKGEKGVPPVVSPQMKLKVLYENADKIDVKKALRNVVAEQVADRAWAQQSQWTQKGYRSPYYGGRKVGLELGPAI